MAMFGEDFKAGRHNWLFPLEKTQAFWRAFGLAVLLFLIYNVLQSVLAIVIYKFGFGASLAGTYPTDAEAMAPFLKAALLGIFPSALLCAALAIWFGKLGLPQQKGQLQLKLPALGWLGWPILILGFMIVTFGFFIVLFAVMGIDPESFSAAGGLADKNSAAGLVEKIMADLAKEPKLFVIVALSAIIGAPLIEELVFRGAFFASLVTSPVGRTGAVLISAALFALAHAVTDAWPIVAVLFVMGILLGLLMLRFASLWVTIACHASWNALQTIALFSVGGTH